jgi:hypothetical protein
MDQEYFGSPLADATESDIANPRDAGEFSRCRRPPEAPPLSFPFGAATVQEARIRVRILERRVEAWDAITRKPGKHGGVLGASGVAVYRALIFRWNPETGRLYPAQETIAKDARRSVRTVRSALGTLEALRLIARKPRYFYPHKRNNRLEPSRDTDEYTLLPETHWKGYTSRHHDDAPDPLPGELWGAPSPMLSPFDQAVREIDPQTKVAFMELTPRIGDSEDLLTALASLARAMLGMAAPAVAQHRPLTRACSEATSAAEAGKIPREDVPKVALAAVPATAASADDPERELRAQLVSLASETGRRRTMEVAQKAQADLAAIAANRAATGQKPA